MMIILIIIIIIIIIMIFSLDSEDALAVARVRAFDDWCRRHPPYTYLYIYIYIYVMKCHTLFYVYLSIVLYD